MNFTRLITGLSIAKSILSNLLPMVAQGASFFVLTGLAWVISQTVFVAALPFLYRAITGVFANILAQLHLSFLTPWAGWLLLAGISLPIIKSSLEGRLGIKLSDLGAQGSYFGFSWALPIVAMLGIFGFGVKPSLSIFIGISVVSGIVGGITTGVFNDIYKDIKRILEPEPQTDTASKVPEPLPSTRYQQDLNDLQPQSLAAPKDPPSISLDPNEEEPLIPRSKRGARH